MNRNGIFFLLSFFFATNIFAQQQDSKSLRETANTFTRQGDFANAIVVLNQALKQEPQNVEISKDIAFNYYLDRNYSKALEIAKPLVERKDASVECFQVLGLIYKAIEERKECEKMYREGLKRFPNSGVLYNEYGEMLWTKQNYEAVKWWEKGIKADPGYSSNYYNASKYYYFTYDKIWSLIYGEIFLNLESYSKRTPEIKQLLIDGYKKLFADADLSKNSKQKDPFAIAYLETMGKSSATLSKGISVSSLTDLRLSFAKAWSESYAAKFPFRLFEYHQQLIRDSLFQAYNQWLFTVDEQQAAFKTWQTAHAEEYQRFLNFQKGRVFRQPQGQFYHNTALR